MADDESTIEKRMIQNQVVFRESNEGLKAWFSRFKRFARQEARASTSLDTDPVIHFVCECSDEKCKKSIAMKQSTYDQIHKIKNQFTILPGHQVESIEAVTQKKRSYIVVKKFKPTPKKASELKPTPLRNS
jgi:antitoxin component YwqK of YwqJK toxin-antitoxin module